MTSPKPSSRHRQATDLDLPNSRSANSDDSCKYLARLVPLVADGEVPIPGEISAADREWLITQVARHRRSRLIQFIARSIAVDIHRSHEP